MNTIAKPVRDAVESVVRRELGDAVVAALHVTDEIDHDGIAFLRVEIVFDEAHGRLDPQKIKSLSRLLREPLEDLGEPRFPVFSFKSIAEHQGAAA
ncbi:MAG: hypothetical protein JJU21_02900 [Salinarimonas sp.]|nr:hypothetical protein [Salinarimonas sp.]